MVREEEDLSAVKDLRDHDKEKDVRMITETAASREQNEQEKEDHMVTDQLLREEEDQVAQDVMKLGHQEISAIQLVAIRLTLFVSKDTFRSQSSLERKPQTEPEESSIHIRDAQEESQDLVTHS